MKIHGIGLGSEIVRELLKRALATWSNNSYQNFSEEEIVDTFDAAENVYVLATSGTGQDCLGGIITEIDGMLKEIPQGAAGSLVFVIFNNSEIFTMDANQKIAELFEKVSEGKTHISAYIDETLDKDISIEAFIAQ